MSEQVVAEQPVVIDDTLPAGEAAPAFELSKYIDKEGRLMPGWKEGLLPEDLRGEGFYDIFTDIKGILKTAGTNAKLIGRKGVVIPTEKSTPSEIDEFHKALGRPDNPEGYKLEVPKGIEDYYDQNIINEARLIFHKLGLNQKQADALWEFERKRLETGVKMLAAEDQKEIDEAENIIREEAGEAYESRLHLANRMIAENTTKYNEERKTKLIEAINEPSVKPYIMDFLANIAKKFIEHKIITEIEPSTAMTPSEAKSKIAELEATPGFMIADAQGKLMKQDGRIDQYKALAEERDKLYRILNTVKTK